MSRNTVMITGASRGLGLEMVRQCVSRGDHVIAAARSPDRTDALKKLASDFPRDLDVVALDVSDEASIMRAHDEIAQRVSAIDLLVNNAGIFNRNGTPFIQRDPSQQLGSISFDEGLNVYRVNVFAAVMVCQQFLPLLRRSLSGARVINVTSELGSLTDKTSDAVYRNYYYDSSKSALNMMTRLLAADLKAEGIIVAGLVPGWVRTDMGGDDAPISAPEAVVEMLQTIDTLRADQAGHYVERTGGERAW